MSSEKVFGKHWKLTNAHKNLRANTEPIFKELGILKFTDKLSYCRSVFMHQYRHEKLLPSFSGIFTETTKSNEMQSRHNDYLIKTNNL